ncbi:MAG: hypothetical protein Q4D29_04385 [Lachnospiraceae bacterium]|nr:hypothetical protein [Lachnospiraceae bacterium]
MKRNSSKGNNSIKGAIVIIVLALSVLAYFYVINNRMKRVEKDVESISAVQELLIRNLDTNYPATPKEVVKLYSEITRCFYAEEYTEEDLIRMAEMSRKLFDDELVANQDDESYIRALKGEIATYRQQNRVITSYSVSSSADVEYYNFRGGEWAQLIAMYSIKTAGKVEPSKERYLLRKDDAGHWKIFGFRMEQLGAGTTE